MIKFEDQKKKLERSSTHIECTFKDTTESFSVDAREYCSNFPKKNVSFWGKNTILSFCTRILLVKEIYRSCLAHTSTKKLRSRERNWGFKRTRTFSSTSWRHVWKHCWKLFCRSSKISAHTPKKTYISGKKGTKVSFQQEKWKLGTFLERFCSQSESFPLE